MRGAEPVPSYRVPSRMIVDMGCLRRIAGLEIATRLSDAVLPGKPARRTRFGLSIRAPVSVMRLLFARK